MGVWMELRGEEMFGRCWMMSCGENKEVDIFGLVVLGVLCEGEGKAMD